MVDAEAQAHAVRQQAQAAHNRVAELREQLAGRPPEEFAVDGTVMAKTAAAKLYRELQAAENPPVVWERREQDAAGRVTTAQRALNGFIAGNVAELVKAREAEDTAVNTRIIDAATDFCEAIIAKNRFESEIAKLLVPARGLDPVNEIKSTDNLGQLRIALKKLIGEGIPSSLPASICPPEGTLPPRVQTADGWVSRAHAEVAEEQQRRKQQEQEEHEAKARRRIQINPPQRQPTAQAERELYSRGWEPR